MAEPNGGEATVDLSLNENQFETLPWAELVLRGLESLDFPRYHRVGLLKGRLQRYHGVGADEVFLQLGAEGALFAIASSAFLRSHAERGLVLADPSWHYYRELAERFGVVARTFRLRETGDAFEFPCEEIVRLAADARSAVILIDSPNNPAGCTLSDDEIRCIHAALSGDQILAIDETYFGFTERLDNRGEMIREMDGLLIIRSFSKYFGLAGMRIGYVLAGRGAREKLDLGDLFLGFDFLAERLACLALDNPDPFQRAARRMVRERESLAAFLGRFPCFVPHCTAANFVPLRIQAGCPCSARSYTEFAARRGVKLRLLPDGNGSELVRVTVGTEEQMERLKDVTARYVSASGCATPGRLETAREAGESREPTGTVAFAS